MAVQPVPVPKSASAPVRALPSPNLLQKEDEESRVKDAPRGNYMLAQPKDEWQMTVDGDLVPVIVQLSKSPGVQGVGRRGEWALAQAYYLEREYTLIPHDVIPSDYVSLYLNKRGQKVHRSVFQTPVDGPEETHWSFDGKAWKKFLKLLRVKGIVQAPRPHVVRQILHQKSQQYEHLRPPAVEDASRRDAYERQVGMLRKQIGVLEEELAKSLEFYGEDKSAASNDIGTLLDDALRDVDAKPATPTPALSGGKLPRGKKPSQAPPPPEKPGDDEAGPLDGDEEVPA